MTTTPKNIDFNGLQINSLDGTVNIITTMNGTNKGLSLNYDLTTIAKLFTMTSSGFTHSSNSSTYSLVCALQTLLSSLSIPPNSTTLLVNNCLNLVSGSNTATITKTLSPNTLVIDVSSPYYTNFIRTVRSLINASTSNDLVNLSYCQSLVSSRGSVIDDNSGTRYYLLLTTGSNIKLYINQDVSVYTSLTYIPSGTLTGRGINITSSLVRIGTYTAGGPSNDSSTVYFGYGGLLTRDAPTSSISGSVVLGSNSAVNLVPQWTIAIGNYCANTFINTGGTALTSSLQSISIGYYSQYQYPNRASVSIGAYSCYSKINAQTTATAVSDVTLGYESAYQSTASAGLQTISIGYRANYNQRQQNTISINATGSAISNTTASSFQMAPLRGFAVSKGVNQLLYDFDGSVTGQIGEVYYSTN